MNNTYGSNDHDFGFEMRLWGWSVWSQEHARDGLRNPALTFERSALSESRWWDRTLSDFLNVEQWRGDERLDIPPWWALCASLYMQEMPA